MQNLVLFANSFLSYLLLMAVIVVIAAVGIVIGINLRKSKNNKMAAQPEAVADTANLDTAE